MSPRKKRPTNPAVDLRRPLLEQARESGRALAETYLRQTGLTVPKAIEAFLWSYPQPRIGTETLPLDLILRWDQLTRRQVGARRYARALAEHHEAPVDDTFGDRLTEEERETLRQIARRAAEHPDETLNLSAWIVWLDHVPTLVEEEREIESIVARAQAETDRLRPARLEEILRTPDGTRHPDPWSWLQDLRASGPHQPQRIGPNGEPSRLQAYWAAKEAEQEAMGFFSALERLDRDAQAQELKHERERTASLTEQLARRRLPVQLGDRIVFPRALIDSGYNRGAGMAGKLAAVEQGELFTSDNELNLMRKAAEVVVERTQLGDLSPSQVRALTAVFRIFSSTQDDGRQFHQSSVSVDARLLYRAAEIDPHNGRACRDLFQALDALSTRQLYVALKFQDENGGWAVAGDRCPVFEARPIWVAQPDGRKRRTEQEAQAIAEAWASGNVQATDKAIPLPDRYDVSLPALMRRVWHSLVVSSDVLTRLDAGAKAVRGPTEGFSTLDWRLFIEITQRVQPQQISDDRTTLQSFVDRDALLIDVYSTPVIDKARARGKYHGKYVAQYEKSVAVLEAHGIARRVEAGRVGRNGRVLDVFEPSPDVIFGLRDRAENAARRLDGSSEPALEIGDGLSSRKRRTVRARGRGR